MTSAGSGAAVALKEEGTATVIDDSDNEWSKRDSLKLYSINGNNPLYIDGIGDKRKLKADGGHGRDDETRFVVRTMTDSNNDQIVTLSHLNTSQVVAIKSGKVSFENIPSDTLDGLNTLDKVKTNHMEILFYKVPKTEGSNMFHLKSYGDKTQMIGFDDKGILMNTTNIDPKTDESLFTVQ